MSIFNFTKKLLPRIERKTVAEDLRTTEKECINVVMPSWEAAASYFKVNKPGSQNVADLHLSFYRILFEHRRGQKAPSFVFDIVHLLPVLHENISIVQGALEEKVEKDILSNGMTMKAAFILRAASNMSMVTRYMMSLLNYIYAAEAEHFGHGLEPGLEISKAEMKYVEEGFERFVKLFTEYTLPSKDFRSMIESASEVFVNDRTRDAVAGLYADDPIDPFSNFGVSGFVGNPIYRVRLMVARWQNDRYESAKAKKQQLELRLLYLQMQKDEKKDPIVTKEISRLQDRIDSLDKYLHEVETDLDTDN